MGRGGRQSRKKDQLSKKRNNRPKSGKCSEAEMRMRTRMRKRKSVECRVVARYEMV